MFSSEDFNSLSRKGEADWRLFLCGTVSGMTFSEEGRVLADCDFALLDFSLGLVPGSGGQDTTLLTCCDNLDLLRLNDAEERGVDSLGTQPSSVPFDPCKESEPVFSGTLASDETSSCKSAGFVGPL